MADGIGQDDEIFRRVQRAARFEQAGELRHQELRASAAGAVTHHHGVDDLTLGIADRRAERAVMLLHLRQGLAVGKAEILRDEIGFGNGRRSGGGGGGEQGGNGHRAQHHFGKLPFAFSLATLPPLRLSATKKAGAA